MKIPYTHKELVDVVEKLASEKTIEQLEEIIKICNHIANDHFPFFYFDTTKAERNKIVADCNGISVDTLISSPNYDKLFIEYRDEHMSEYISKIMTETFLTEKEIYGLFYCIDIANKG